MSVPIGGNVICKHSCCNETIDSSLKLAYIEANKLLESENNCNGSTIMGVCGTPLLDSSLSQKTLPSDRFNADVTPLMYSRCSSMSSLNSVEQHSIHDDYSSVFSDFSQRASGVVSPSDLPDSPTHAASHTSRHDEVRDMANSPLHLFPTSDNGPLVNNDVFDDNVTRFKEEGTPVQFSSATSLSALTVDKELQNSNDASLSKEAQVATFVNDGEANKQPVKDTSANNVIVANVDVACGGCLADDICDPPHLSDEEDGDEDILAACINVGMQGCHKYRKPPPKHVKWEEMSSTVGNLRDTLANKVVPNGRANGWKELDRKFADTKRVHWSDACEDAMLTYHTEGTPVSVSHACSQSDLSVLSFSCDGSEVSGRAPVQEPVEESVSTLEGDVFDDILSIVSEDCDDILAECIRSGMPKPRDPL